MKPMLFNDENKAFKEFVNGKILHKYMYPILTLTNSTHVTRFGNSYS